MLDLETCPPDEYDFFFKKLKQISVFLYSYLAIFKSVYIACYQIPTKNKNQRNLWLAAIRRKNWSAKATKTARLCSCVDKT